jgi:hypothetical protein
LRSILDDLHNRLPLELRELIYSYLVADYTPTVVPRTEAGTQNNSDIYRGDDYTFNPEYDTCRDMNPFRPNYVFDTRVMGQDIAYETREYLLRNTPLYFRGPKDLSDLAKFLDIKIQPCKSIRDCVRHLRVYLRCENLLDQWYSDLEASAPPWIKDNDKRYYGERCIYERYRVSLEDLCNLPYKKHPIKVEICVLHQLALKLAFEGGSGDMRYKYNLFEAIKPTYFHLKKAGADISVRFEYRPTGEGEDVTWQLDMWEGVSQHRATTGILRSTHENCLANGSCVFSLQAGQATSPAGMA